MTPPAPRSGSRLAGEVHARVFGAIVLLTDLLPPRIRYGYVHRATGSLLRRFSQLPSLPAALTAAQEAPSGVADLAAPRATCALVSDHLDVGGIGSVVEMLALGLPAAGIRPVVICRGDGDRARRLAARGVEVIPTATRADAQAALDRVRPDVIELHNVVPDYLEDVVVASDVPLVTVMHNTEIHFTPARWRSVARLIARSEAAIAVSRTVRDFHVGHLPDELADRIVVVGNAAPAPHRPSAQDRRDARAALEGVLGLPLADQVVFACLARYDSQKNIAGMVWSFLEAIRTTGAAAHLVVAGAPSDRAELLRADGLRRSHANSGQVHLLGNSDGVTLLAASDAFLLDSFFEGWPVAATEAASMGLPLLLSDVGGAGELVSRDPGRSILVGNPAGSAVAISDAAVRRARFQVRRQANAEELARATSAICATVAEERRSGNVPSLSRSPSGPEEMVGGHAEVLLRAKARRGRNGGRD